MGVIGRVSGYVSWQASRIRSSWAHLDDHAVECTTGQEFVLAAIIALPLAAVVLLGVVM